MPVTVTVTLPVIATVKVIHITVPVIVTVIAIHVTKFTMSPLVELPVQAHQILATWQTFKASNILETADPTITQAVTDTITLLEMLTTAPD